MNHLPDFSMSGDQSILMPEDCGLVNGHLTLNGWLTDVAAIRGIYAPPVFSDNFQLNIRFNGRRIAAASNVWAPDVLTRKGRVDGWNVVTRLVPVADSRAAVLAVELSRRGGGKTPFPSVQLEVTGGLARAEHWGFGKPRLAPPAEASWKDGIFALDRDGDRIAVAASRGLALAGAVNAGVLNVTADVGSASPARWRMFVTVAIGPEAEAMETLQAVQADPEGACRRSRNAWRRRVKNLYGVMPSFTSDNDAWRKLYDRSMLHLLLNEWNVPEFALKPFYSTGGINGGCIGNYLWNYGEPYRLWSILDPKAAREHLKTFLNLDLTACFAFNPDDGSPFGPYYPINQEKIVFLTRAYVLQTRDTAFLHEVFNGRTIIEHVVEQALALDDVTRDAVLVDYGNGNHHLELRRALRYDGIVPDLNLRRCVTMQMAAELCDLAAWQPPVDLRKRARALKALIRKKLFDKTSGWYAAVDCNGKKYLRYTMQLFKAIGWGDWAMGRDEEEALVRHVMDPSEFLGDYGLHSLSKKDPAYDEFDIDNGGPGACVSFTPAVVDRLYRSGRIREAEALFTRLQWLADCLPYWGDSQRADIPEYRRDTPLQNDIQGAALAQTIIFGMFGIDVGTDFSVTVCPHLPENTEWIALEHVRLAGRRFSVMCTRAEGVAVTLDDGRKLTAANGEPIVLKG